MERRTSMALMSILGAASAGLAWRSERRRRALRSLQGRKVLITGGTSGLGFALARNALEEGAEVRICGRNHSDLEWAVGQLEDLGDVHAYPCDVTDSEQVREFGRHLRSQGFFPDMLINNAGIIQVGPATTFEEEDFERTMGTHLWGALHFIRDWLPYLRRSSRIVNITSIGGVVPVPHMLPYVTSKYATVGLSEGLRSELRHRGIRVTTVIPGLMRTGSHINAEFSGSRREYPLFAASAGSAITSLDVDKAAQRILACAAAGKARCYVGWYARLGHVGHALFGEVSLPLFSQVAARLPGGHSETPAESGAEIRSRDRVPLPGLRRKLDRAMEANQPPL